MSPERLILANVGLKRRNKALRKQLAKARLAFTRIMAETREAPDWFYESSDGTLSEDDKRPASITNLENLARADTSSKKCD